MPPFFDRPPLSILMRKGSEIDDTSSSTFNCLSLADVIELAMAATRWRWSEMPDDPADQAEVKKKNDEWDDDTGPLSTSV